jgi:hypothetical protein
LVKDPSGVIVHSGTAEKEGEFIFVVDRVGEYTFCFSNTMSTFAEKTVNFDIVLSSEHKPLRRRPAAGGQQEGSGGDDGDESVAVLDESLRKVREGLVRIERSVRYYKIREKVGPRPCSVRVVVSVAHRTLVALSATLTRQHRPSRACSGPPSPSACSSSASPCSRCLYCGPFSTSPASKAATFSACKRRHKAPSMCMQPVPPPHRLHLKAISRLPPS